MADNRLKSSSQRQETAYRVAWQFKEFAALQPCVFESDVFRFPFQEDSRWKIHFQYEDPTLEVQLISTSKGKAARNISGVITFIGNPDTEFEFGPEFTDYGDEVFYFCDDNFAADTDMELSIDMWISEEHAWNPINVSSNGSLSGDLMSLVFSEDFSDVIVEVEDEAIPAHKSILSARSDVFMTMFKSGMLENQESRVTITDTPVEVVKEMLRYAYTDQVIQLENLAAELMIAADKYNMCTLKNKCRNWLIANITKESAAKLLIVADCLNDEGMKEAVTYYIVSNLPEVLESAEWKSFETSHPGLMAGVVAILLGPESGSTTSQ